MNFFFPIVIVLAFLLRFNDLWSTPFFGDQAWFYLSAKDALFSGKLPLLGITSSIIWLNQGPLWTYLLIPGLVASRFHPLSGAVLSNLGNLLTLPLIYYLGCLKFGRRTGLITSLLFATSPLVIHYSRLGYHTSFIPLFTAIFLLQLHHRRSFLAGLFLGFLYQLHLVTFIFWPLVVFFALRRKLRLGELIGGFLLGILPLLVSGPLLVPKLLAWAVKHAVTGPVVHDRPQSIPAFFYFNFSRFFFAPSPLMSLLIGISSFVSLHFRFHRFYLWLLVPVTIIAIGRIPAEIYLIALFVPASLVFAHGLSSLPRFLLVPVVTILVLANPTYLISRNYVLDPSQIGPSLSQRLSLSRQILAASMTANPQVSTSGPGDIYATAPAPYQYLIWWLARTQPASGVHSKFVIFDQMQTWKMVE